MSKPSKKTVSANKRFERFEILIHTEVYDERDERVGSIPISLSVLAVSGEEAVKKLERILQQQINEKPN